ncbi:hypothetical protein ACLOJK_023297 [Asimina triloba]
MMGTLGILFFFFLEGLKLDPKQILKAGKREVVIAATSMVVTFAAVMIAFMIRVKIFVGFFFFVGVMLSTTSFAVLNPILREFNILNSQLGQVALSTVMLYYVVAWLMIISFHVWRYAQAINGMWAALAYVAAFILFCLFMMFVVRPATAWIIRRTPEGGAVDRKYIILMQFGATVMGLLGDLVGVGASHGSLLMGMVVPDGPPLAAALVQKTEVVLRYLLLPFFFASVGLRTDLHGVFESPTFVNLTVVFAVAFVFKFTGTLLPALYFKIPLKKALALSLMSNFRGLVELFLYSNWTDKSIMSREVFKIMVWLTLVSTVVTAPLVQVLTRMSESYGKYNRTTIEHSKPNAEMKILACVGGQETVPTIIRLLDASYSSQESPICVYLMNLVELVGRANPMLIEHDTTKKHSPFTGQANCIITAFRNLEQSNAGSIFLRPFSVMAPYNSMHHDICALASDRKVSLMILPYHKQRARDGMEIVDPAFKTINPNILAHAPCSIGVLVDVGKRTRIMSQFLGSNDQYRVAVLFSGGPDCREALSYALRMASHPSVVLSVVRFLLPGKARKNDVEKHSDEEVIANFQIGCADNKRVVFREETVSNGEETVKVIRSMGSEYDLLLLGRGMGMGSAVIEGLADWQTSPELGVIGDFVSAPDFFDGPVAVLVLQQQLAAKS